MKTNHNQKEEFNLIGRYLANEMSEAEAKTFITNLEEDNISKQLLNKMQNDWNNIGKYKEERDVNTDKAWSKLFNRLDNEQLVDKKGEVKSRLTISWTRWAAIALVLVTAGVVFFTTDFSSREKLMIVQTPTNSGTLVQTLTDGSIIYMASNTELTYPNQFSGEKRRVSLKGEAFFDISHNPNQPFVIETKDMLVEVLGTSFNLKTNELGKFELMVETGLVKVTMKNGTGSQNLVSAGEKLAIVNNNMVKTSSIDKNYLGWRVNRMRFKDEKLSVIIQIINRNYNSNIILGSPEIGEQRITVTFHENSLETITDLICKTLMLKAEEQENAIILLKE